MSGTPVFFYRAIRPFKALFVSDAREGILLIFVAALAMVVANSIFAHEYHAILHDYWFPKETFKLNTLHLWINDGLMAIFFFVVGLEVKRELIAGNLADPARRRLPVIAAVAGMAGPALVFVAIAGGDSRLMSGWAIPAATDIAFAMGVIGLLGNRVPASLRLFLLTVAIVDDIGAVMIIALFYTANLSLGWLAVSFVVMGVLIAMNRFGVNRTWPYVVGALVLWFCVLNSGIHATIAGVAAALTIPMKQRDGNSLLEDLEHALVGWSAFLIVPVFGFANAGVDLSDIGMDELFAPLPMAIAAGLFFGNQVGIFSIVWIVDKLKIARRPENASWAEIWGVSLLCGIGFTMSLFIGELAFPRSRLLVDEAKIGILLGSLLSAVVGYTVLRLTTNHPEDESR